MIKKKSDSATIARDPNAPLRIGCYIIEKTIGKGNFAVVKLARHTITQIKVAIKIIDKTRLSPENLEKAQREAEILKMLQHEHIMKLYQVLESPRLLYIVTEYLPNGELFEYIAENGRLSEYVARYKFLEILSAVAHCHRHNVVHRDLKAENMLLDQHMSIKLADFGFGNVQNDNSSTLLTTFCGSPPYAAPEIFKGEPYCGTKADIWSLGVLLYVLVVGVLPFGAYELPQLREQVLMGNFRVPFWLSNSCEELMRAMMAKNPHDRPSVIQLYRFKWLAEVETCPPMLTSEPRLISFASPANSGMELLTGTIAPRPHCRSSLVCPPTLNLAAEMKTGKLNHLVIQIMENSGMNRQQILESLGRCAYDHLMATYLLLGEHLRQTRHSLPHTLAPRPTEIHALVEAQLNEKNQRLNPIQNQPGPPVSSQPKLKPRSSCHNERALDHPGHFSMKDSSLMNVIFPPRVSPKLKKSYMSQPHSFHSSHSTVTQPLPGVSEPTTAKDEHDDSSFDTMHMEDEIMMPQAAEFLLKACVLGVHPNSVPRPAAPLSPINLSCRSEVPQPAPKYPSASVAPDCFDWWFPDQPEMMPIEDNNSSGQEHEYMQTDQLKHSGIYVKASTHHNGQPVFTVTNANDFPHASSSRLPVLGTERCVSNDSKDISIYLPTHSNNRGVGFGLAGQPGFMQLDPFSKSVTDDYTSGLGSSVEADSRNSSFSTQPRFGPKSSESACEDMGIDIPNAQLAQFSFNHSESPLHPAVIGQSNQYFSFTPQKSISDMVSQLSQHQSPIDAMPEYLQNMARRKFGVSTRPEALQKHIQRLQMQLDPPIVTSVYME